MKYIKPINEFNRTIGFRYSEPTIKFNLTLHCVGELDEESLSKLLKYTDVPYENIQISNEENVVETENEEVDSNLKVQFDFLVYNESEIEKIVEEVREGLFREFDVDTVAINIKKSPMLK